MKVRTLMILSGIYTFAWMWFSDRNAYTFAGMAGLGVVAVLGYYLLMEEPFGMSRRVEKFVDLFVISPAIFGLLYWLVNSNNVDLEAAAWGAGALIMLLFAPWAVDKLADKTITEEVT